MSKSFIEKALRVALDTYRIKNTGSGLFENTLTESKSRQRENEFTRGIESNCNLAKSQVRCYTSNDAWINVDMIRFNNRVVAPLGKTSRNINPVVDWTLEVKHYSPHSNAGSETAYLRSSVGDCVMDLLKLSQYGFQKSFILQIQTQINDFQITPGHTYEDVLAEFPFFQILSKTSEEAARANIDLVNPAVISKLKNYSKHMLDAELLYNSMTARVHGTSAEVRMTIHYLISGPFNPTTVLRKLPADLDRHLPLENQIGGKDQIQTWDLNISTDTIPTI